MNSYYIIFFVFTLPTGLQDFTMQYNSLNAKNQKINPS